MFSRSVDELLEVSAIPVQKALFRQDGLLILLFFSEGCCIVDFLLLEITLGFSLAEVLVAALGKRDFIPDLLTEICRLSLLQITQERREELIVMHGDLFWGSWGFRLGFNRSAASGKCLPIVFIHGLGLFLSLSF